MRITKLPAGDTVFGQPIEKGYSILSSENDAVRHGRTMPDYIFSGGMDGGGVQYLRWPGYHEIGIICPYRTDNYTGTVLIYKLNEE